MGTRTASPYRTSTCTEAHRCRGCQRAFWADKSWNRVRVVCPHCGVET